VTDSNEEAAYKRGMLDATVAEHSRHFLRINGTLEVLSKQMADAANRMAVAAEQAAARDAIAVHTAQTVKDTRQEAIDKSDAGWKPWQRIFAAVAAVGALIATGVGLAKWWHP
jgi:hypothetical protein